MNMQIIDYEMNMQIIWNLHIYFIKQFQFWGWEGVQQRSEAPLIQPLQGALEYLGNGQGLHASLATNLEQNTGLQ